MLGLINRAIQCFLRDTFGDAGWQATARAAGVGKDGFEPMLHYEMAETEALIAAATGVLDRPRESLLEDLGTYLVSHPNLEPLRRLLRFGGTGFRDFLMTLEDMPGRGRLALPDLDLPMLTLEEVGADRYVLTCRSPVPGAGHVVLGLLRAMADDYGALVLLEHLGAGPEGERVSVVLLDTAHWAGRRFDLTAAEV
ncbi:MAG TPA: heme NO-binding domain-containing protein [Paracoccaceae bacterium]|nr:heme NO-binding domain-containing protein [Paracoccaceae bacterium]HMO72045.1 heme NO-binding domain-containing protein [Paracoccaceae bacterium]